MANDMSNDLSGKEIRKIEEVYIKCVPSREEMELDGWILRFSNGYDPSANCVIPLCNNDDAALEEKVAKCEEEYVKRGMKPTFKLLSNGPAKLSAILEKRGYNYMNKTIAMTHNLKRYYSKPVPTDKIHYNNALTQEWIDATIRNRDVGKEEEESIRTSINNIKNPLISAYYYDDKTIKGTCLGVIEEQFLTLYFLSFDRSVSHHPMLMEALVNRVLLAGQDAGLETACARALSTGIADLDFFRGFGFKEAYSFIYRQKA